jgi:hypothetical protein
MNAFRSTDHGEYGGGPGLDERHHPGRVPDNPFSGTWGIERGLGVIGVSRPRASSSTHAEKEKAGTECGRNASYAALLGISSEEAFTDICST